MNKNIDKDKVCFRDLSFWLKLGIAGGIYAAIFGIMGFIIGFIEGLMEVA